MQITIDNNDGLGPVPYTDAVATDGALRIVRKLNAPSLCTADLLLEGNRPAPARRGRVKVRSDAGLTLFTGYLATEPARLYAGQGTTGPVYRLRMEALSDEWVLNRARGDAPANGGSLALASGSGDAIAQLTQAAQTGAGTGLRVSTGGNPRALGAFAVTPAADWSANAGAAANATYSSLRVLDGSVNVQAGGYTTHIFQSSDGTLALEHLSVSYARELANDVTLSGSTEPAAYVQEHFRGDGTTAVFPLSETPYRDNAHNLLEDDFEGPGLDPVRWLMADAGGHLQLTSAGLTVNGGNGMDGQTTLTGSSAVEMGGFLLAELKGVLLHAGSDGMLAGFYAGASVLEDCFLGFRVRQSASTAGGNTVVVPVVNGKEAGQSFQPVEGHRYTLRLRAYCVEMQRVPQRFYCMVDGVVQEYGASGGVEAPMQVVFDVLDEGVSSNTPATVLYDSAAAGAAIQEAPATCSFVAVNATNLFASIGSLRLSRPGSVWVVSTLPDGTLKTRLLGAIESGVDCVASYSGSASRITFLPGRIPAPGERVSVLYRTTGRAVARLADNASVAAEAVAGASGSASGVSRWLGHVLAPAARCSADCEAAAQAVLAIATSRAAAMRGSYETVSPAADVWPGDLLQLQSGVDAMTGLVRSVELVDGHSAPELIRYRIQFANDWATEWEDGMGLRLSDSVAADASLPVTAAATPGTWLGGLQQVGLLDVSGSMLQVDAGVQAPTGGGFEVRRRDWEFGPGVDASDLVLRSPVRNFSLPRMADGERLYIRMYDGSTPPLYSRMSAALIVNWPVGDV